MDVDIPSIPNLDEIVNPMLKFALFYASHDMPVLPLHSVREAGVCTCGQVGCNNVGKHPLTQNGVKDATTSPERIRAWWKRYPFANVGIATGNCWLVIDIDPRHGGSLEAKVIASLPKTMTVRSGSGGWHLYFHYSRTLDLRNTAGKLGPGIDTRAEHGYVVAPPSLHALGTIYTWLERCPPASAPASLLHALGAKPKSVAPSAPIIPPALNASSEAAFPGLWLLKKEPSEGEIKQNALGEEDAPPASSSPPEPAQGSDAVPEGRRNTTLVSLAGALRRWGAKDAALFPMLQVFNQGCCNPPLSDEEVHRIYTSALRWMPGSHMQESDEDGPASGLSDVADVAFLMDQELPELRWAVQGFLPEGVSILAGKPKMGKSWLALALGLAIVSGKPALGSLPTQQGEVLYLGLEDNQRRICDRVRKMIGSETLPPGLTWGGFWSPLNMGGLDDLETWIKATPDARLIIIDTLARVRPPGTGSGIYAEDYATITPLKQLAEEYHLSILLVHHLRKTSANDPMDEISGSTGLTGATDCNMVLQRERGKNEATLHITGRDVEEQALSLIFAEETACWSLNDNPTNNAPMLSPDRQAVIDLLQREGRSLGPVEIAQLLNKDRNAIRQLLYKMTKAGLVMTRERGLYVATQQTNGDCKTG